MALEEVIRRARPKARRRLVFALEMRDRATFGRRAHQRYTMSVKHELVTIFRQGAKSVSGPYARVSSVLVGLGRLVTCYMLTPG